MYLSAICAVLALTSGLLAQTTHTVELAGMDFTPADITITIGDTVMWDWVFGFHNVESGTIVGGAGVHDQNFRSGDPTADVTTTFVLLFDQAFLDAKPMPGNLYPYFCIVHAGFGMRGTIMVLFLGDIDGDTDIDLADHAAQVGCLRGPDSIALPTGCSQEQFDRADIDNDNDVDLRDVAAMQRAFTG